MYGHLRMTDKLKHIQRYFSKSLKSMYVQLVLQTSLKLRLWSDSVMYYKGIRDFIFIKLTEFVYILEMVGAWFDH